MSGLTDLDQLLAHLEPSLREGEYVFITVDDDTMTDELQPLATFVEDEGRSLIVERERAEAAGLAVEGVFRCITLTVRSSLEAVGLTAAVAGVLAEAGISANVVAAFHHDHVFVPAADAERALSVLRGLQQRAS
ncbi:MAG: ACT domain-containing protein [Dehalococcoidia bacterium]|nr:ACT domain-containing protein [Dehalococcoidia bacterium]